MATRLRCGVDLTHEPRFLAIRDKAQAVAAAHRSRRQWQTVHALAHPGLWRDELIVGAGLGVWQGVRLAQGCTNARGAMSGVALLFPMAMAVFRPLGHGQLHSAARRGGRWLFDDNRQAHRTVRHAMRLALSSALWTAHRG